MPPQGQGRARRVCPRPRDGGPPSSRNAADCRVYDARWMSHLCAGRRVTPERRVHWSRENEAQSPARPVWRPSGLPKPCAPGFSRAGRGPGDGTRVRGPRRGRGSPVAAAGVARRLPTLVVLGLVSSFLLEEVTLPCKGTSHRGHFRVGSLVR